MQDENLGEVRCASSPIGFQGSLIINISRRKQLIHLSDHCHFFVSFLNRISLNHLANWYPLVWNFYSYIYNIMICVKNLWTIFFKQQTIFVQHSISDVWQVSEYASAIIMTFLETIQFDFIISLLIISHCKVVLSWEQVNTLHQLSILVKVSSLLFFTVPLFRLV